MTEDSVIEGGGRGEDSKLTTGGSASLYLVKHCELLRVPLFLLDAE